MAGASAASACRAKLLEATGGLWQRALSLGIRPSEIGIVLSGGVDTAALLEALAELGHKPAAALTVFVHDSATDIPYATAIAQQHALEHHVVRTTPDELVSRTLPRCVRVLASFDGMQLRNSMVVALALERASELGLKYVFTGDASDELLGGYSFTWGVDEPEWSRARAEMCADWFFSAPALAADVGVRAESPFMEGSFAAWALSLPKEACIGEREIELSPTSGRQPHTTGKLPLRDAFPHSLAAWRRKDPIEVGSGSTVLGRGFFDGRAPAGEPGAPDEGKAGVRIRDEEHRLYFREFARQYPRVLGAAAAEAVGPCPARSPGAEGCCVECGYTLYRAKAMFCRTCGAWPARAVAPAAAQGGDGGGAAMP